MENIMQTKGQGGLAIQDLDVQNKFLLSELVSSF